jgi:pSer/pThr/pTyr-binding forkhead associated (FHA) protein
MTLSYQSTPQELRQRIAAERNGLPFIVYRGADGSQQIVTLRDEFARVTVGRAESCEVRRDLDPQVSRLHAELVHIGDEWVIVDDGLSRNGSFVNDVRVTGRRRLRDGDAIRCGTTSLTFRDPFRPAHQSTRAASGRPAPKLTDAQLQVLAALSAPMRRGDPYALPAPNRAIAEELFLSVGAVKGHLRALFDKLGVEELPHNQKRLRLVELAYQAGLIQTGELHTRR